MDKRRRGKAVRDLLATEAALACRVKSCVPGRKWGMWVPGGTED